MCWVHSNPCLSGVEWPCVPDHSAEVAQLEWRARLAVLFVSVATTAQVAAPVGFLSG